MSARVGEVPGERIFFVAFATFCETPLYQKWKMPLDCPNKVSSSTPFLTLRTQTQDTLRRLGRPTAIFGTALGRLETQETLAIIGLGRRDGWDGGWGYATFP